jgi:hypothetical protein
MFDANLDDFFVVAVISNTARFKRRAKLFMDFRKQLEMSGVNHVLVELAFGDREYFCTDGDKPHHLRLRTVDEFWHKENLINLGITHGVNMWSHKKKVLWSDADCAPIGQTFTQWFEEIWHELQHHEFVQAWEWMQHLDIDLAPLNANKKGYVNSTNPSFMSNYVKYGTPYPESKIAGYPNQWGSPGLAWAANIDSLQKISMVGDVGVTGGGDWYLAHMLISDLPFPEMKGYTKEYIDYWKHRQDLAERWVKRDVGFVKAFMMHYFHGKISDRGYNWRERILQDNKFNPLTDLKKDAQGLWQLETHEPRQIKMRDQLRRYARSRNEDSIDS